MDADRIRELAARRERGRLDFKKEQYPRDKSGAAELAKDVMAMANALRSGDEPAHILVGVVEVKPEKTGLIVGIPAEDCEDDAHIQQRIGSLLNRVPSVSFEAVQVDGLLVGVYTIYPGRRPFFPLRDSGDGPRDKKTLIHHVAFVRRGSSTDIASPEEIIEWHREDFGEAVEAVQIANIRQLSHRLDMAHADPKRAVDLLGELAGYTREGLHVRHEVLRALHPIMVHARSGLEAEVAARSASIAANALELAPGAHRTATGVDPAELPLLEEAARFGGQLAYDAVKAQLDQSIVKSAARLLWEVLRVAHLNDLVGLKAMALEEFEMAIDLAGPTSAEAKVLSEERDDALDIAPARPEAPE